MITDRKRSLKVIILLVSGSFVAAHLCFRLLPNVFETWNAQAVDQMFLFRSSFNSLRPSYNDTIVHVDLNDTSIQRLDNFYLNRSHHAKMIKNLAAMGVSAQLYDFIFAAHKNEKYDQALVDAVSKSGNVYFGMAFNLSEESKEKIAEKNTKDRQYLDKTKWDLTVKGNPRSFYIGTNPLLTIHSIANKSKGLGFLNLRCDRDGVFRRMPLLVRYGGGFYPGFSFRAVCDYLDVPPKKIIVTPGENILLQDAKRPGESSRHDIVIPIDEYGNMLINFIGSWERMKHYNFSDVLLVRKNSEEMEIWHDELSGKIVIVSEVSTGSSDIGPVPTDTHFPLSGLHANLVHTVLTESFLKELSFSSMLFVELSLLLIILLLSLRLSSLGFSLGTFATVGGYIGIAILLFFSLNTILHLVRPLLMVVFSTILILAYRYINEEKEKEVFRRTLEAYFPPLVVKKVIANPEIIASGGQKKELTILFSDIKDFTRHTANMTPDQIQRLLNEYFGAMTDTVFKYKGTVDKFMGDGMMVFFGDPEPQPDHALLCVRAAIDMQRKTRLIRAEWEKRGGIPIQIRIGINTDTVVVGNMGSSKRLSYTVLGSPVNMAQRLESNAPAGGILISQRTYNYIKGVIRACPLGKIELKGFDESISVYEVPVDQA